MKALYYAASWLLVVVAGCTSTPRSDAPPVEAGAPVTTPLRLAAGEREICALDPLRAFCIGGPARDGAPFSVRVGPPGTAEVMGACHRNDAGSVRCQGVESAQNVTSLAASPYALRADGTVVALDVDDGNDHVRTYEQRRRIAESLGVVKKVVHGPHGACALRPDETVVCWTEPWTLLAEASLEASAVRAVPGISGVVDLFLHSWLQLCVLDHAGTVRCSSPPPLPLDGCVLHGKALRCGRFRPGAAATILQGPTFDPAELLARPLDVVTTGATSMAAFQWPPRESVAASTITVAEVDPGGCAVRAEGVVCWSRSPCTGRPWVVTPVQGLPGDARVVLGAQRGYGLGKDGALYTFLRRAESSGCAEQASALHAVRMDLAPAHDVAGGLVRVPAAPGYGAADCASLRDGSVWCWRSEAGAALGTPVRVPLP